MRPVFTNDGIEVQTFSEIYDELVDGYKTIYGADIDLSENTPDGQRVVLEAQARLDLQSFALALYSQLDPDFAVGTALERLVKFSGISRHPAVRSQVDVTITTDRDLTLPAGYIVADTIGQRWVTTFDVSLVAGANTVTLVSEQFGAFTAGIDTVTSPVTIVLGVLSVTNPAVAVVGEDEETDEDLRIRRNLSLMTPATSSIGGLYSAIGDIQDVRDLRIYENYTNTLNVPLNLEAHTIWCIVDGGAVSEIAEAIAKSKSAGCGLKGSTTGTYIEDVDLPDGSVYEYVHSIDFDRPVEEDLYIELTVTRKDATIPVDVPLIEAALVNTWYSIGESAHAAWLYGVVYSAGDTFVATDLEVSLDGITYTDAAVYPAPDGRLVITAPNITITEVV